MSTNHGNATPLALLASAFVILAALLMGFPERFPGDGILATVSWRVEDSSGAEEVDLEAYRRAVLSDEVLADALRRTRDDERSVESVEELRERAEVTLDEDAPRGTTLRLDVRAGSERGARARAEAIAAALEAWDVERSAQRREAVELDLRARLEELNQQVRILQVEETADPTALEDERDELLERRESIAAEQDGAADGILIRESVTTRRVTPWTVRNAVIAALLGAALSGALTVWRARASPRRAQPWGGGAPAGRGGGATVATGRKSSLRPGFGAGASGRGRAKSSSLSVLGSLPYASSPDDARLRQAIAPLARKTLARMTPATDEATSSLLITSTIAEEGKTTFASLLAEELARGGKRVLLVDGHLAAPGLARRYDVGPECVGSLDGEWHGSESQPMAPQRPDPHAPSAVGPTREVPTTLAWLQRDDHPKRFVRIPLNQAPARDAENAPTGEVKRAPPGDATDASSQNASAQAFLDLVPQFRPARPAPSVAEELFDGFGAALRRWDGHDVVLIDGAPLLPDEDARLIALHVDAMLIVVDRHGTRRHELADAENAALETGCPVLGLVVNDTLGASGPVAEAPISARPDAAEAGHGVKVRDLP